MRILISGARGFVGSALREAWTGDAFTPLARSPKQSGVPWDPAAQRIDRAGLEGFDAVIHLAGEPIMGRWTARKKRRIHDSRAKGTGLLSEALASLDKPPAVMLSASAIGYYGHRYGELLHEYADPGSGFMAGVCRAWEAATRPAAKAGIRVVHIRIGVVLGTKGGALKQMLTPFKLGLGGKLGRGDQYMSWIAIGDLLGAMRHCIEREVLEGPVNLVAPNPVTSKEFAKTLGRVLRRPAILPMPGFVLRLLMGEMGGEALTSIRVEPERLKQTSFAFQHPELEGALRHLL